MLLRKNETVYRLAKMVRVWEPSYFSQQLADDAGGTVWVFEPPRNWIACKVGPSWNDLEAQFKRVSGSEILRARGFKVFACGLTNASLEDGTNVHNLYFLPFTAMSPRKLEQLKDPSAFKRLLYQKFGANVDTVEDVVRELASRRPRRVAG